MNIIFLDIDGVLITHSSINSHTPVQSAVDALQKIIDAINPGIVISSSWRLIHGFKPEKMFEKWGLKNFNILGKTPYYGDFYNRGHEIERWLQLNCRTIGIDKIIIIDDNDDMNDFKKYLFKTNFTEGLTDDFAQGIIEYASK